MLVFIDESGIAHPNNETLKPTVAAVCLPESCYRRIDRTLYSIKQRFLGNPDKELKAKKLLRPYVFANLPDSRELVESVFDLIRGTDDIAVYASITERPARVPAFPEGHLPIQYKRLFERIQYHLEDYCKSDDMAVIIYDGDGKGGIKGGLSKAINAFLFRSRDGATYQKIITTPFFVNSEITPGVQIADLIVGCIRLYEERDTNKKMIESQVFSSAINRFYKIIKSKTHDFDKEWAHIYGLGFIREEQLYEVDEVYDEKDKTGMQA